MKFLDILKESREDNFKQQFTRKFGQENVQRIVDLIEPKFLNWVGQVLETMNFDQNLMKVKQNIDLFKKYSTNLPKTDISQYKSIDELATAIKTYVERPRRSYKQVEGGNVVYEDDRFFVVNPLTPTASCYYGKGTKWCTAAETNNQFVKYNDDGKLFYILDKTKAANDPMYKIALLKKFDGEEIFYDAKDEVLHKPKEIFGEEIVSKLIKEILDYMNSEFSEQLAIFADKERVKKEKERIEALRRRREQMAKEEQAEERRLDNEWDLNSGDCDEECLKANGVLRFIDETNNHNIITNEDREYIASLKSEIERLNNEYNQSEDVRTDLLDSISELEDELEGYSEYIDLYSIIPLTYDYYGLSQFELITDGHTYAAGTQQEMADAVVDYVNQLVDDIGYEGFRAPFVEDHVDADMVADHFRDFWEEDINNSPEAYFDDESRMLSDGQNDQISHLKKQIQYYRTVIQTLEARLDDEEEDEITSKIEEFESNIEELESEIEEIESDPEGDFPQDLIDEKVEEMIEDVRSSPLYYVREHGLEMTEFIDRQSFVDAVVDEDGWGVLCPYDGNYEEYNINDKWIYVFRLD